jgi:CheY-like chemotaxis protein
MSARILVADDSVTIQKVVELTFSKEDFTLIQARSGEEALRKAKETRPDLILLDLVMPDKNGYDVCIALRADPMLRTVPIILLAGTFESFDQQRGTQAGANDFVTKPFESQVLIGKVKQLLFSKAVDARSAAGTPKSPTEAPTVRIPPPPARPEPPTRAVPPPSDEPLPPRPAPAAPSQDDMWQLLDSPGSSIPPAAPAAAPEAPGELRLEELTAPAAPASPEGPSLDLDSLDLESAPAPLVAEAPAAPAAVEEIQSLPESLSLDDLLGSGSGVPISAPRLDGPAGEPATFDAVFELPPMETPPLPMVEAGKGEPPTLSVEELLGSPAPAPAGDEAGALDFRDLDLTSLPEAPAAEEQALSAPAQPEAPFDLEASIGLPLEESAPQVAPDFPKETPVRIDALDFLPSVQGLEETAGVAEAAPPELPAEISPVQAMEEKVSTEAAAMAALDETAFLGAAAAVEEATPPLRAEAPAIDMAAMREEVTARVAHDLTRELSEKLLERFEKIVWEVVPDLAELLITKEIERIRKLADEEKEQSS